ncbi:TetR/AcrR family transcriptional regulator [Streptosporangium sp. NPDC000396]|uniref:TetR/AcrR family transcriptional regulator n=1 Tax=Streptosporangium sp. NPDC000396 TaxID=3366185 RepID=UPI0036A85C6F
MSGKSDPARSLALLWGAHTRPGRSGLTVRSIVEAAMELADAEGLEAAAMRRVAERLGVGTMSLYTHIPGKAELTDLMVDTALGELYADVDEPATRRGGWRDALEFIAERNWNLYQRHPWLLQAVGGRPSLGPNAILKYEAELRALDGIGLSDVQMDSVLTLVLTQVEGVARTQAHLAQTQHTSGLTEEEWWLTAAPMLEKVVDARRFPVASRVGQAAGEQHQASIDPAHAFGFGLARILDGVERLIEAQGGPTRQAQDSADQGE